MERLRIKFNELDGEGPYTYKGVPFTGIVYNLNENNKLIWEGNFKDGMRIGWWKNYYESGFLESEGNKVKSDSKNSYGVKEGVWKEYFENGQLKSEGIYRKDRSRKEGLWKEYYENGQLHMEVMYDFNEKVKIIKQYDKTGKVVEPEYEFIISGVDNMSGYGDCGIKLSLNESQWEEYLGDDYDISSPGGIIETLDYLGYKKEWVMVMRYQIFDKNKYYEISEIETFNSSKKKEELNKTYYCYGDNNYPNPTEFNLMNEEEIKEFEKEWEYDGDNRYFGIDVYSIENFDLELELETGYF